MLHTRLSRLDKQCTLDRKTRSATNKQRSGQGSNGRGCARLTFQHGMLKSQSFASCLFVFYLTLFKQIILHADVITSAIF